MFSRFTDFLEVACASDTPPLLQDFILMVFPFYRTLLSCLEVEKCVKIDFTLQNEIILTKVLNSSEKQSCSLYHEVEKDSHYTRYCPYNSHSKQTIVEHLGHSGWLQKVTSLIILLIFKKTTEDVVIINKDLLIFYHEIVDMDNS